MVTVEYKNWRGETAIRKILPKRIWWGSTKWHPQDQWMLSATDIEKGEDRDFAMSDMKLLIGDLMQALIDGAGDR